MPNYTLLKEMSLDTQDHYAILGLSAKNKRKISADDIKTAYKQTALQSHPDKHPNDPNAKKKFQAINHAHELLSDPVKKRQYDKMRGLNLVDFFPHFIGTSPAEIIYQRKYFGAVSKQYKGPKVFFAKVASAVMTLFFLLPFLLVESLVAVIVQPFKTLGVILIPPFRRKLYLMSGRDLHKNPLTIHDKVALGVSLFSPILWPITAIFLPIVLFSIYRKLAFIMYSSGKASQPAYESTHKDMHAKMKPAKKSKKTKNDKSFELEKVVSSKQSAKLHTKHPSPLSFMQSAKVNTDKTMQSALEESAMASYLRID